MTDLMNRIKQENIGKNIRMLSDGERQKISVDSHGTISVSDNSIGVEKNH